jgi:hypothetical protein
MAAFVTNTPTFVPMALAEAEPVEQQEQEPKEETAAAAVTTAVAAELVETAAKAVGPIRFAPPPKANRLGRTAACSSNRAL